MSPPDRNRIDPIVPQRDDMIGRRSGGSTSATSPPRQKTASAPRQAPPKGSGGGLKLFVVILFLGLLGVSAFGWFEYSELASQHKNLQQRFDALESRLSSTDESVSQSGAALQMRINGQQDELKKHWSEIKKLWGVSNDINKKKIEANKKDINFLSSKRATMEKSLSSLETQAEKDSKTLANVGGNYLSMSADLDAINQQAREAADSLNRLQDAVSRIDSQLKKNAEAIESIDAYRRQINQKIYNLEQGRYSPAPVQ